MGLLGYESSPVHSNELFESAESLGRCLGISRSRLYATALADYVARHKTGKITARLDAVYASEPSGVDKPVRRAQARSLPRDSW